MGKIMRNDVEYGGGSGGGGDVSQLEQRVERLEDGVDSLERYKVTQLTLNTGIDIGDWDSVIDTDEPVIYERYTNYHDAVAKLSQQIDIMGARTDTLKTSLNDLVKVKTYNAPVTTSTASLASFTMTLTIDSTEGYTVNVLESWDSGAGTFKVINYWFENNTTIKVQLRNLSATSATSARVNIVLLYVKQ